MRQAEDLLAAMPQKIGVAKAMFEGRFVADWVFPYPQIPASQRTEVEQAVAELERFCDEHLDPAKIDREADIPREVIDGVAELGVLGMTAPTRFGGRGFSQMGYCRLLEVIGARCSSTAIFVNAHHSIGMRALLLFGIRSAEAVVAAGPGERAQACGVRTDRAGSRFRCGQRADDGHSHGRMARVSCSMAKSVTSRTGRLRVC